MRFFELIKFYHLEQRNALFICLSLQFGFTTIKSCASVLSQNPSSGKAWSSTLIVNLNIGNNGPNFHHWMPRFDLVGEKHFAADR